MENSYQYLVSTQCFTYNQAAYIKDTLRGFYIQETSFPVVFVVVDDASTDGEDTIIKEWIKNNLIEESKFPLIVLNEIYGEGIIAKHNTNNNISFAFFVLSKNLYKKPGVKQMLIDKWTEASKYKGFCEGDDCWIDPLKLQKQVNYLESHDDCSLVHTDFRYINEYGIQISAPDNPIYSELKTRIRDGYIWQYHLLHGTFILLCTCLCRAEHIKIDIDHAIFMTCARQGKVHYMKDVTSCYRVLSTSLMRTDQRFVKSAIRNAIFMQLYYFCHSLFPTASFYYNDLDTRVCVSEAIISSIRSFKDISVERKWRKLLFIIFSKPLNLLFLPIALIYIIIRKVK